MTEKEKIESASAGKTSSKRFSMLSIGKLSGHARLVYGLIGGIVFLSFYLLFISRIPPMLYQARDDGVITLSHARNLVEYDSISVNPSGERVEGFSSPLEFWLYYLVYRVHPVHYKKYSHWQGIVFVFLLGFFFIQFFRDNPLKGIFFTILSGFILFSLTRFTEWTGSGMENSISNFMILLSIFLMFAMFKRGKISYYAGFFLFLATLSRAESAYFIFPLLLIFVIAWWLNFKQMKEPLLFLALVMLLWTLYKTGEFLYFGALFPNTALGEDINLLERLKRILTLNREYLKTSAFYGWIILREFRIALLLSVIPALVFIKRKAENFFLFSGLLLLTLLSFLYPLFFGPTRLDFGRANTHIAVIVVLFLSYTLFSLKSKKASFLIIPAIVAFSLFWTAKYRERPVYLCCSTSKFERMRRDILKRAKKEDIPRPSLANVDLGAISWHKDFNIVDLAKLGSPILARLKNPVLIKDYLFEFAAPDFIELHDWWSCAYSYILSDERFKKMYEPLWSIRNSWLHQHCKEFPFSRTGIWIRKDIERSSKSRERKFLNYLMFNLSLKRIKKELEKCTKEKSIISCEYVTRNVYRLIPELVRKGIYRGAVKLFSGTRTAEYDLAILEGRTSRNWYKRALNFLYRYELEKIAKPENLLARGKFDIYVSQNRLLLLKENCSGNIGGRFVISIYTYKDSSPRKITFRWEKMGFKTDNKCVALMEIPFKRYSSLKIIHEEKGTRSWSLRIYTRNSPGHM